MSTPVGHSRLQPLHETQRSSAAFTASSASSSCPESARRSVLARPRVTMLLVQRRAVRGAHRAGVELAAVAVVVAHLDRLVEAAPLAPVERRCSGARSRSPAGSGTALRSSIFDGRTIFPGFIRPRGSSQDLISPSARGEARAEERRDPLRAHQAVAVLAGIGALVLLHQRAGFLGDGAHLLRAVAAHVEHRAHVQRAHRGVRVPGAARAVLLEHRASAASVYSARCSSGTAQSSMKDTGLPSPFIDIMMFRPALRTSTDLALQSCVGDLDHAAREARGRPSAAPASFSCGRR